MTHIEQLNSHGFPITPVIETNLKILFERVTEFQEAYGKEFIITSGLRSDEFQNQLIAQGKTNAKHSKHCAGLAADIQDPDGKLAEWVQENILCVTKIGLWFEDFGHTMGWVHCQIIPPLSGKRVFLP